MHPNWQTRRWYSLRRSICVKWKSPIRSISSVSYTHLFAAPNTAAAYFALFQKLNNYLIFDPLNNKEDICLLYTSIIHITPYLQVEVVRNVQIGSGRCHSAITLVATEHAVFQPVGILSPFTDGTKMCIRDRSYCLGHVPPSFKVVLMIVNTSPGIVILLSVSK